MGDVWWCSLPERHGVANDECYNSLLDVAMDAGKHDYHRLSINYARTDFARNEVCRAFLTSSRRDDDLLVMLDADHRYPGDILSRLAGHPAALGVVGSLAFRRGVPYDPLFFLRDAEKGGLYAPASFEFGPVYQCAMVTTSAISIRRWVFIELERKGYTWPWFRYEYPTQGALPSEDMYFGYVCERAGIWHHCDTGLLIPHATNRFVDRELHEAHLKEHPELIGGPMTASAVV